MIFNNKVFFEKLFNAPEMFKLIFNENNAKDAHYKIGKNMREFIEKNGGTIPEELPTPKKSLKELEKEKN